MLSVETPKVHGRIRAFRKVHLSRRLYRYHLGAERPAPNLCAVEAATFSRVYGLGALWFEASRPLCTWMLC